MRIRFFFSSNLSHWQINMLRTLLNDFLIVVYCSCYIFFLAIIYVSPFVFLHVHEEKFKPFTTNLQLYLICRIHALSLMYNCYLYWFMCTRTQWLIHLVIFGWMVHWFGWQWRVGQSGCLGSQLSPPHPHPPDTHKEDGASSSQ